MRNPLPSPPDPRIADLATADPGRARLLAADIAAAGYGPPVLIVADHATTAVRAPQWAESFAERGWLHRVLAFGGCSAELEIRTIVAEARSSAAAVVVAAGDGALVDVVRRAAAAAGLPWLSPPVASIAAAAGDRDGG